MKKPFKIDTKLFGVTLILIALFFSMGCEDVIQVDLNDAGPKLVVEGYISNEPGRSFFLVSRSTDFYQPNDVEAVSGAEIIITDDTGRVDTMFESTGFPGLYVNSNVAGQSGHSFMASVTVDGHTYFAETSMTRPILLDSLGVEYQPGGGVGTEEDEGYKLHVFFQDNPEIHDYARLKVWQNQIPISNYYLYDGKFSDGNPIDYEYFLEVYQPGDTLTVNLLAMDADMYDYFLTLEEVMAGDDAGNISDATPANPNSNWSDNLLGYFGAFYSDIDTIIVQ